MTETSEQKICRTHTQEGLAVDLNPSPYHESRYYSQKYLKEIFLSTSS